MGIKVKHQGFRFNCEYCHKTYRNIQILNHHLRKNHPDEIKDKMKEMSFLCDLCSKVFSSEAMLYYHKREMHIDQDDLKSGKNSINYDNKNGKEYIDSIKCSSCEET